MASRRRRAWVARFAVVTAAFAVPLLAAIPAQAAVGGGGSPEKTVNRPDLVSATYLPQLGSFVDFCFDKTLVNQPMTATDFRLGGYRSGSVAVADEASLETTIPSTPADSCVRAHFNDTGSNETVDGATVPPVGDITQYTIGTVLAGSVNANGGATAPVDGNWPSDSVPLTGSKTNNGTTDFTTAPDLTTVFVDPTTNTITYVHDQNVAAVNRKIGARDFYFVDQGGNTCHGTAIGGFSGPDVTISFAGDTCSSGTSESVTNAVRAGEFQFAVSSANDLNSFNADQDVVVPNPPNTGDPSGQTAKPDLTQVSIESDQSAMDFTFNKTSTPDLATDFYAVLSTGDEVHGTSATVIATSTTSTTVRVTFPNFSNWDEYVVGGAVNNNCSGGPGSATVPPTCGAVYESGSTSPYLYNTPSAAPLQPPFGNKGALAEGYTTAPDIVSALGNSTTGVVSMVVDQRAFGADPAQIQLYDDTGNEVAAAGSGAVQIPSQAAGPETIDVTFSPGQVRSASNLAITCSGTNPIASTSGAGDCGAVHLYQYTGATGSTAYADEATEYDGLWTALGSATGPAPNCVGGLLYTDCPTQFSVPQVLSFTTTAAILRAGRFEHVSRRAALRRLAHLKALERAELATLLKLHRHVKSRGHSR